jgi:hypothetical protein
MKNKLNYAKLEYHKRHYPSQHINRPKGTSWCPALQMKLNRWCYEGDGYYCDGYCPFDMGDGEE